jgi:hypothetical protein
MLTEKPKLYNLIEVENQKVIENLLLLNKKHIFSAKLI